jgi:RHS repeat-associated protein
VRVAVAAGDHYTNAFNMLTLGLIDMRGRIYDPLAGRFMSPDPIMQAPFWSQGLNRYSYVYNDPINATDPSGFMSQEAGAALAVGVVTFGFGAGAVGAVLGATAGALVPVNVGGPVAGYAINANAAKGDGPTAIPVQKVTVEGTGAGVVDAGREGAGAMGHDRGAAKPRG